MLKCPYCHQDIMAEELPLTEQSLEQVLKFSPNKYSDETKSLIFRILQLTPKVTALTALKFLSRISRFNDEQVNFALGRFFQFEYQLKGYEWQWAAGMVNRENNYKSKQLKNKLSGLPKTV